MIQTFITKPTVRQAVQWTGENFDEIETFTGGLFEADDTEAFVFDQLHTTWVRVYLGQWVVKGSKGEFWPVDREVFAETYRSYAEDDVPEEFRRELFAETAGKDS